MFYEKVYNLTKKIPKGKVSTYKEIGIKLNTKAYRLIGQALKNNPDAPKTPCHRVVSSKGELYGFSGSKSQKSLNKKASLLKKEGIKIKNNKILNFEKILHKF